MDFREWIKKVGGIDLAARVLDEKARTVASWHCGDRAPSFQAALNIVKKTHGLVDYNGIYRSFAELRNNKKAKKLC